MTSCKRGHFFTGYGNGVLSIRAGVTKKRSGVVVGVCGSRGWRDLARVRRVIEKLAQKYPGAVVISGGAPRVDLAAEQTALDCGLSVVSYRPYKFDSIYGYPLWSIETVAHGDAAQALVIAKHRRINPPCFRTFAGAAFGRNGWIAEDSNYVLAFWDGASRGTADTIKKAKGAGVSAHIYREAV